jgi:hypothetical protein
METAGIIVLVYIFMYGFTKPEIRKQKILNLRTLRILIIHRLAIHLFCFCASQSTILSYISQKTCYTS